MKTDAGLPRDAKGPATQALLEFLLSRRSPTRVNVIREELGLTAAEFAVALRSLERKGWARRMRLHGPDDAPWTLNPHMFVEATEAAFLECVPVTKPPQPGW